MRKMGGTFVCYPNKHTMKSTDSKDSIQARYVPGLFLWISLGKSTRTGEFRFVQQI